MHKRIRRNICSQICFNSSHWCNLSCICHLTFNQLSQEIFPTQAGFVLKICCPSFSRFVAVLCLASPWHKTDLYSHHAADREKRRRRCLARAKIRAWPTYKSEYEPIRKHSTLDLNHSIMRFLILAALCAIAAVSKSKKYPSELVLIFKRSFISKRSS